jgi:hypothetical protein
MSENVDVRTSLAMSKDAVGIVDFAALASPQGVQLTLDKGNNHVLVLFPSLCCNHHASRAVPQVKHPAAAFNTAEHVITVSGCKLTMANGNSMSALTTLLPVGPGLLLTYGQVIALGGDFYGDPEHPVCNAGSLEQQIQQFQKNFASLQPSEGEVKKILQIAEHYEFKPIAHRVSLHQPPSGVYASLPTSPGHVVPDEDRAFDEATGGTAYKNGRYLNLAATNLDHFGVDAMTCYNAGHILAQRYAIKAKHSPDPEKALMIAYAVNAFADHFLTDLFAAGHMRTPRRKLYESAWNSVTQTAAGICAKGMHDEDNKFGLWVENARGDKWVAYGDARYRDWCNAANRTVMKGALQQSINDVWNAFKTSTVTSSEEVFSYLPKLITEIGHSPSAQKCRDDLRNWAPLFWWNPDKPNVWRRVNITDGSDRTYEEQGLVSGWGLSTTAVELFERQGPYMPEQQYRAAHFPFPPDEKGPSGEIGWPAGPTWPVSPTGPIRVIHGATGPDLHGLRYPEDWRIDGTPGPSGNFENEGGLK